MIFVIATARIKPGSIEACLAAAKPCIAETVKENGCISYDVHVSVTDPEKVVFVERWESKAHLQAHTQTEHFKVWRAKGAEFVVGRTVEVITPAEVGGL